MLIGINESNSQFYEGSQYDGKPITSNIIFQRLVPLDTTFSQLDNFPDDAYYLDAYALRELSFDPITRIKRGILYTGKLSSQPQEWKIRNTDHTCDCIRLLTFQRCNTTTVFGNRNEKTKNWCAIGEKDRFTIGELISVERLIDKRELLTFRMRNQFGLLPDLDKQQLNNTDFQQLNSYIEKVLEGAHSSPPESVIDRCREAAACALSINLNLQGKDLAQLIKPLMNQQDHLQVVISSATIINRLHSRGKNSMQTNPKHKTPTISDKDAELAVICLGTLLRDLGYASWG